MSNIPLPSRVIHIDSDETFEPAVDKAQGQLVFVDFFAHWCGPCRRVAPIFDKWSTMFQDVTFLKVNIDECPGTASQYQVKGIPHFIFIKDGIQIDHLVGADVVQLETKLNNYRALEPGAVAAYYQSLKNQSPQ